MVNEGQTRENDLRIRNGRIEAIQSGLSALGNDQVIDLGGKILMPGVIDDQVHFREPGFPHKANIFTESKAAVAGGVTSYMEMPNTQPTTTNAEALDDKLNRARGRSWANYGFFFGATNHNLEAVLTVDPHKTCGIKIFMGSSTGDMLVDDPVVLEKIFSQTPLVIATHCEDEQTIRHNMEMARSRFGDDIPMSEHPLIRSREACFMSSSLAIQMAKKFKTQLHILHLTTAGELPQFSTGPMEEKHITAEVCVHHLWYSFPDYERLGGLIKCNPAIKDPEDQSALWQALAEDRIDIIASDHAPHTWEEKHQKYAQCPSGLPLVQHELNLMLDAVAHKKISMEKLVQKMCHNPARRFSIRDRGFLREGYFADMVVVDPDAPFEVHKMDIQYHCGWSPLEGIRLKGKIEQTFVNGHLVFDLGAFHAPAGFALEYQR